MPRFLALAAHGAQRRVARAVFDAVIRLTVTPTAREKRVADEVGRGIIEEPPGRRDQAARAVAHQPDADRAD